MYKSVERITFFLFLESRLICDRKELVGKRQGWSSKYNAVYLHKINYIQNIICWYFFFFFSIGRIFFIFIYLLFSFIFISRRLITLQYWSGFCHLLTWISHGFTCIPHPDPPSHRPLDPIPLALPSAPGPSTCLMLGQHGLVIQPGWWSVSP